MGALIDLNGLGHYKSKENAMVASVYSATKTYAVGDYAYYNGTLYRCTTAITTAEAWTSGHWTAAKIGDDVTELKTAITQINSLLPIASETGSYVELTGTTSGQSVKMEFTAAEGNRVYCGGENLFDGVIRNIALGASTVITSSTYRGFYVPVKGGITYTISRSSKSSSRFRIGETSEVPASGVELLGQPYVIDDTALSQTITTKSACKYLVVYLSNSSEDVSGTNFWVIRGTSSGSYSAYTGGIYTTSDSTLIKSAVDGKTVCWCDSGEITAGTATSIEEYIDTVVYDATKMEIASSNVGNFSIVCAKEHSYVDGSLPVIEYYLIEECGTQKFFFTKDFVTKQYAFTFSGTSANYAFGILENGDVIACVLADALEDGKDDSHRTNPYCWLASENWATQHEVEFSTIPPCGWLSNCGFKLLADGTALFAEYTRMTVATANVWKINGTPTNASNWSIVKSFTVTTEDNNTGFKHIHMVMQDPWTGVVYFSTGDDDDNAMIWYSTDDGATWTQLGTASQKYCRNLSFTFTADYIYWAPDTTADSNRYLFRAGRDANGVLDFANKTDYVALGGNGEIAAYGTAYIPELQAILVLDRSDAVTESIPLKIVDLTNGTCSTIATLDSPSGTQLVGFRTRFSEWYPHNGIIRFGFGFKTVANFNNVNHIKGFGNAGNSSTGAGAYNINNLVLKVFKNGTTWGTVFDTMY